MDAQRRARFAARLIALLAVGGCDCDPDADPASAPLASYFPLSAGDRWRSHVSPTGADVVCGISAIEQSTGMALLVGSNRALAERYRATSEDVSLVDPDGNVLSPILRAPIREGASFAYELGDDDARVPCEATIRATGVHTVIAGSRLDDCVEVRRECRYPPGKPFRAATKQTIDERFCPNVGRVHERMEFEPAPEGGVLPRERTEDVVWFIVAGAPRLPEPAHFDCNAFPLLATDVASACVGATPELPVEGTSAPERCTYRYAGPDGPIEISAARADSEVSVEASGEGLTFTQGRYLVRVTGRCEGLARLEPLLRSLLPVARSP